MRPRVLLVDDEVSIRESLRKLLQAEDYDVELAVNGKEAVDKFRSDPMDFDLVLTDLNMPLRNGWASVDRLLEVNPRLPIVVLTGMANQRELAETSAVSALVEKPIDVPVFLGVLRELLASASGRGLGERSRRLQPFHFVPSSRGLPNLRVVDPYSHWGLNE